MHRSTYDNVDLSALPGTPLTFMSSEEMESIFLFVAIGISMYNVDPEILGLQTFRLWNRC